MTIEELRIADSILERVLLSIQERIISHDSKRPKLDDIIAYTDSWIVCNDRLYEQFDAINQQRMELVESFCNEC